MNIYERVKFICNNRNLTISAVEIGANISNGSISKWKTQMPKADNLYSVANFLNTSVEYFLTGKDNLNSLSQDQQELLDLYSQLDERGKGEVIGFIKAKVTDS